jgi:hypothetical protein
MRAIYHIRHLQGLRLHDIYIPGFMKIGAGVQAILRLCPRNLNGCCLGITDVRDLLCTFLRCPMWHDLCTRFLENRFRHLSDITVITATI